MARAFIIRPFGKKEDSSGAEIDFDRVQQDLVDPALEEVEGLEGGTTGEIIDAGNIREDMFEQIVIADLVVCDITILNANVFYELGIRHALRKKSTVMIRGDTTADQTPFDLLTDRYLTYRIDNPAAAKVELVRTLRASLAADRPADSPIFQMLRNLPEANPATVIVIPPDFEEEVDRAKAAGSKGWLRLLTEDVGKSRFEWSGLRRVAQAQWDLKDFAGARASWEAVRETRPKDVAANLALANIYERLYRESKEDGLLTSSDHALKRVLSVPQLRSEDRIEALTLTGRNQKTRWRMEFANLKTTDERRERAMNSAVVGAYKAYYAAFEQDFNNFYAGLAAMQMGLLLQDLGKNEDAWADAFSSDDEADDFSRELTRQVEALKHVVPAAADAGIKKLDPGDDNRLWAEISRADVLFLTEDRQRRVVRAYTAVIPKDKPFAWDAAKGQLELFADLGFRADLARAVIEGVEEKLGIKPAQIEEARADADVAAPKLHLVLFAGHRVDEPGREPPRFPPEREDRVRELIAQRLRDALNAEPGAKVFALASAAPGADIIFHEVCRAADSPIESHICLPMPANDFAASVFEGLDGWRSRYLDLQKHCQVLTLSDRVGLPRWLQSTDIDPWERGNRWVMQMAQSWGADRVTLMALWDGRIEGDRPGGTAQMVKLAEGAGDVYIERIKTEELFA